MGVTPLREKGTYSQVTVHQKCKFWTGNYLITVYFHHRGCYCYPYPACTTLSWSWTNTDRCIRKAKQLTEIKTSKAQGPDDLLHTILMELPGELAPFLMALFTQSLKSESLNSWRLAQNQHLPCIQERELTWADLTIDLCCWPMYLVSYLNT